MAMDMLVRWQRVSRSAVVKLGGRGEVGETGRGRGRGDAVTLSVTFLFKNSLPPFFFAPPRRQAQAPRASYILRPVTVR